MLRIAQRALLLSLTLCVFPATHADLITTERALIAERRATSTTNINAFLARSDVAAELARMGVDPQRAIERVDALTLDELTRLESHIQDAPAGAAGIIEIVGVVVVVLIILELFGVTDVFTNF